MNIRFVSSMTADDEKRVAVALVTAVNKLLAPFPLDYAIHIETSAGDVLVDSRSAPAPTSATAPTKASTQRSKRHPSRLADGEPSDGDPPFSSSGES